jgi:serine/threonine protein kinase/formylglycine-generating enzyme required for sulfatase activity
VTEKDPAADRLELLVDQFDALWQQGSGPKWTAWLEQAGSAEEQTKLARLLVPIELEYRRQRGETIEPERDYPEASTEQLALVRELLTPSLHEDATLAPNRAAVKVNAFKDLASQTIGPYKLLQKLGEGGMGEVWMAEQKEPVKRRVALKLIKGNATGSREILARFEAERQALALMNHPNIARILDAGTTSEGQPFFVMELVQGQPLTQYCDQNKVSIEERLRLFLDACSGVQHAHQKGIIHRDLKPANILVGATDGKPVAKVIDFGLAKALESTQRLTDQSLFTGIGQILGTLKYMSPEQASLDLVDVDTRTDVYALGVILYELLTGTTPLDDDTIRGQARLRLLEVIREQEPLRPSSKLSHANFDTLSAVTTQRRIDGSRLARILSGDLDWVVMKALEKDRVRRYDSAAGLAEDVQRYLTGEPVSARPPSRLYRFRKWIRKHPAKAMLLATASSLLLTFLAGSYILINQQRKTLALQDAAEKERIANLVDNAFSAEIGNLPTIFPEGSDRQSAVIEGVRKALLESEQSVSDFRRAILEFIIDPSKWDQVVSLIDRASPQEVRVAQEFLRRRNPRPAVESMWGQLKTALQPSEPQSGALGLAALVAAADPTNPEWDSLSAKITQLLINSNSLQRSQWTEALLPLKRQLQSGLFEFFDRSEIDSSAQDTAAELLASFGADRPDLLARIITRMKPRSFELVFEAMKRDSAQTIPVLLATVKQKAWKDWPDATINPAWELVSESLHEQLRKCAGEIYPRFAYCHRLPFSESEQVANSLARSGYRLVRFRPYLIHSEVLVGAVWTRDGAEQKTVFFRTARELQKLSRDCHRAGFVPVDISGYLEPETTGGSIMSRERYVSVWTKSKEKPSEQAMSSQIIQFGLSESDLEQLWTKTGGVLQVVHHFSTFRDTPLVQLNGKVSANNQWNPATTGYSVFMNGDFFSENSWHAGINDATEWLGMDDVSNLSLTSNEMLLSMEQGARLCLEEAERLTKESPELRESLAEKTWQAAFAARDYQRAITELTPLIAELESKLQTEPWVLLNHYGYRALAYALLKKDAEAQADLARMENFLDPSSYMACLFPAIICACLNNEQGLSKWLSIIDTTPPAQKTSLIGGSNTAPDYRSHAQALVLAWMLYANPDKKAQYEPLLEEKLNQIEIYESNGSSYLSAWENDPLGAPLLQTEAFKRFTSRMKIFHRFSAYRKTNAAFESRVLLDANLENYRDKYEELIGLGYEMVSLSCAEIGGKMACCSVWHRPRSTENEIEQRELARARAAICLFKLGQGDLWPEIFETTQDPRGNAYFIESISDYGLDPRLVLDWLRNRAKTAKQQRTLLLALGSFPQEQIRLLPRNELAEVVERFSAAQDSGVHFAAIWLQRTLQLAESKIMTEKSISNPDKTSGTSSNQNWYSGPLGLEFAKIPAGSFVAGSNYLREPNKIDGKETPRLALIARPFGVCSTTITTAQYELFLEELQKGMHPELGIDIFAYSNRRKAIWEGFGTDIAPSEFPVTGINPNEARQFCNWLSKKAGFAPADWYYVFDPASGEVVDFRKESTAYRLPSGDEWEYCARAGSNTRRFFGYSDDLLSEYCWYQENSFGRPHPAGQKKPNPFGLFDIYGNILQYCDCDFDSGLVRGGGHYDSNASSMRSAGPFIWSGHNLHRVGFRVAQTLPGKQ